VRFLPAFLCTVLCLLHFKLVALETLDLEAASSRATASASSVISRALWNKFENFLDDPDFSDRFVDASLNDKFPELPLVVLRLDTQELLKVSCHLKKLHLLTPLLKEAYENLFFMLEFSIDGLNARDTSCLWSCIANCCYKIPDTFFEKLDYYTAKETLFFESSLILSTLQNLCTLKEGRAFHRFAQLFSEIEELVNPNDLHNYVFLSTYLSHVKDRSITFSREMRRTLKSYKSNLNVKESSTQRQVLKFLQRFDSEFQREIFNKDLDTYLDIVHEESKIAVEVDGKHHYKENASETTYFKRPLDLMRDDALKKLGWKVYRIRIDEWDHFKRGFSSKMHERSTFDTFLALYLV
jgi:very-short-patch-repair endonuclease